MLKMYHNHREGIPEEDLHPDNREGTNKMETIRVLEKTEKTSTTGKPYVNIKTDKGFMSIWNGEVSSKIHQGKAYEVEVEIKGKYKNVIGVGNEVQVAPMTQTEKKESIAQTDPSSDQRIRGTTESYAVSMYNAEIEAFKGFCKTQADMRAIMEERRKLIAPTTIALYQLQNLDKMDIEGWKYALGVKQEPEEPQEKAKGPIVPEGVKVLKPGEEDKPMTGTVRVKS